LKVSANVIWWCADVVHQDAGYVDRLQHLVAIDDRLHLRDHDTARVVGRLRHGQQFVVERLAMCAQVAARVRRRATDQRAIDAETGIEQVLVAPEIHRFHPVGSAGGNRVAGALVDGAAVVARVLRGARVHEGVQADLRQHTGLAARNGAIQVRQHALRQVEAFAILVHGQRGQARGRAPVPADDGARHAGVAEVIHPACATVALPCGIDQRQVARQVVAQKALLQRLGHAFGMACADKSRAGHGPATLDEFRRLRGGDHLHCRLLRLVMSWFLPIHVSRTNVRGTHIIRIGRPVASQV
jgi:hypothetical protein